MPTFFHRLGSILASLIAPLEQALLQLSHPIRDSMMLSTALDHPRNKTQLLAENALLRQPLIRLRVHRQTNQAHFTRSDRLWLVLLASRVQHWKA